MIMKRNIFELFIVLMIATMLILAGCNNSNGEQSTPTPAASNQGAASTPSTGNDSYPEASAAEAYPDNNLTGQTATYPGTEGEEILTAPPNPERELPSAQGNNGVIGGVLIREITDEGFIPFDPYELILGEIIENVEGQPVYLSYNEQSIRAETYPTGIFIFQEVPPGTYGLIVNMAVAEFPVRDANGEQIFITVEPGQAIDMGQVIIQTP